MSRRNSEDDVDWSTSGPAPAPVEWSPAARAARERFLREDARRREIPALANEVLLRWGRARRRDDHTPLGQLLREAVVEVCRGFGMMNKRDEVLAECRRLLAIGGTHVNPRRRNPKGSAWAQWIFGLGFPMNDPIVELAAALAAGVKPGARMLRLAAMSAERWKEGRDKRLRSAAASIERRLVPLAQAAEALERERGYRFGERSLTGQPARNPRRRGRKRGRRIAVRAKDWVNFADAGELREFARASRRRRRNPRSRRGAYYVRDQYLGDFLDFPSVKVAARFARNRFGCEPAAECVYVEDDERLVPIGALRRRNPRRRRSRRGRR